MAEMFFEVQALADTVIPEKYTLQLKYADETFSPWNPYATRVVNIASVPDHVNFIYTNLDDARIAFFDDEAQNAVDDLNTFFGYTKYTLALLLSTDTETWIQIQEDVAVLRNILEASLSNKSENGHTHDANDINDLTVRVGDRVDALRGQPGGIASLDASGKVRVSDLPTLTKSMVGLSNVDNTSDANKPVSTAVQSALNGKAASSHTHAYADITGKPTFATVATSGSYNDLSNKPTIPTLPTRTFNNPTRSLNTSFQISSTQDAQVSYSVDIATALSLSGGQAGTVYLRYADDTGFTTNVKEVGRFASSNTGALTIGLALNQIATGTLSGLVPAGKYVRIVTENNTGTPTFTYRSAQEVLL